MTTNIFGDHDPTVSEELCRQDKHRPPKRHPKKEAVEGAASTFGTSIVAAAIVICAVSTGALDLAVVVTDDDDPPGVSDAPRQSTSAAGPSQFAEMFDQSMRSAWSGALQLINDSGEDSEKLVAQAGDNLSQWYDSPWDGDPSEAEYDDEV
jgi:hypothetical protein